METLFEAHDDSSGARSSVKSEDGSPSPDGERGSPPPNCAICLGRCRNKSFTDSCLHQFCFKCLVTWSKVKTECPLCKQNFKSIIHNVKSNNQYEEYRVEQGRTEEERIDIDDLVTATRRFRYRTTLTFPRGGEHLALQRLLMHYPPLSAMVNMPRDLPDVTPAALPSSRRRRSPSSFRRTVYRHNLWARPLPDFTGRHRDCTPEFYRYNSSQMHRLVPWLNRELHYLLLENAGHIAYVLQRILELLPQYHITSSEFREDMYRYFGSRTNHFLHELHCFASTPYDLTGYDRNVQYTTDSRVSNTINNVISSSDSDSGDSDIVEVLDTPPLHAGGASLYRPVTPILPLPTNLPGPSARRVPDPVYPQNQITTPIEAASLARTVIPIETISHSDTDDDEVMVTGYIKPPSQRTPEVVDLRDSDDSDVVVTMTVEPGPPLPPPVRYGHGPVQLTLSRPRVASATDESEGYTRPRVASATDESEGYTQPRVASATDESEGYTPPRPTHARRRRSSSSSSKSLRSNWASSSHPSTPRSVLSDTDDSDNEAIINLKGGKEWALIKQLRERNARRRRNRHSREAETETSVPLASTSMATDQTVSSETDRRDERRKKSKSTNGKGVKSSRRVESTNESRTATEAQVEPRAGPSSDFSGVNQRASRNDDIAESSSRLETTTETEDSRSGTSSRTVSRGSKSRRTDSTDLVRRPETVTEVEEPRPGPSRPGGSKSHKSSRRDESTTKLYEEARPGPSSRPSERGQKSSRKDDTTQSSRRYETTPYDDSRPGPSSRSNEKSQKSYRKDDATESSIKTESTTEDQEEPRAGPSTSRTSSKSQKSSRRDDVTEQPRRSETLTEVAEPRPGSSSRPKGSKLSRRDDTSDSKKNESTTELRAGSSSRHSKAAKSTSRDDTSEPPMSGSSLKRKTAEDVPLRRNSRESKRLKSVVKKASGSNSVLFASSAAGPSTAGRPSSLVVRPSNSRTSSAGPSTRKARNRHSSSSSSDGDTGASRSSLSSSDSDDDIPLNLTIRRSAGHGQS